MIKKRRKGYSFNLDDLFSSLTCLKAAELRKRKPTPETFAEVRRGRACFDQALTL